MRKAACKSEKLEKIAKLKESRSRRLEMQRNKVLAQFKNIRVDKLEVDETGNKR